MRPTPARPQRAREPLGEAELVDRAPVAALDVAAQAQPKAIDAGRGRRNRLGEVLGGGVRVAGHPVGAGEREALENVLIPFTIEENIKMCKDAGFKEVDTIFQWANFVTFMARV